MVLKIKLASFFVRYEKRTSLFKCIKNAARSHVTWLAWKTHHKQSKMDIKSWKKSFQNCMHFWHHYRHLFSLISKMPITPFSINMFHQPNFRCISNNCHLCKPLSCISESVVMKRTLHNSLALTAFNFLTNTLNSSSYSFSNLLALFCI